MFKYFTTKLIVAIFVLLGVASITFFVLRLIPGGPAEAMAGPMATLEDIENIRKALELDKPIIEQYISYMRNLLKGDFGYSYKSRKPVKDLMIRFWPGTFLLSLSTIVVAVIIGVPIGIYAAVRRGSVMDTVSMGFSFVGLSVPSFWLGLILIIIFGVKMRILPFWGIQGVSSYVLPTLTLSPGIAANIARMTRASMLEILSREYVRTAKGKGVSENKVIYIHALRNAAISVVTIIGLQMGRLLGGQVVTETIFSWPGLGRLITDSLLSRDYLVVQTGIIVLSATYLILNLLTDLSYAILDPRVRF